MFQATHRADFEPADRIERAIAATAKKSIRSGVSKSKPNTIKAAIAAARNSRCLDDPALAISAQIVLLEKRYAELDEISAHREAAQTEKTYLEAEKEHLTDRILALRKNLGIVQATSLAGAAAQLQHILALADFDLDESDVRAIKRLGYSIMKVITADLPKEAEIFLEAPAAHLDPWRPYSEQLRLIGVVPAQH
jgi:hypothetical protein